MVAPPAPTRIDVGGHSLRVAVLGEGSPPLVCLHGLADTLAIWDRVAGPLAERGRVVLVDQRGHGGSDAPPGPYRREDLAADVRALCDRLGIARAVLVGHSMGGVVAMTAALTCPERVAGLVLVGTASQSSPQVARWYEKIARAAETAGVPGLVRAIYGSTPPREVVGDAQGMAHVVRCLASLADDPLTPRLGAVACPTLLVVGEKDPMGAGASVIIQRNLPGATLEIVPACGHWVHVDAPEALLAAVDHFLGIHFAAERRAAPR